VCVHARPKEIQATHLWITLSFSWEMSVRSVIRFAFPARAMRMGTHAKAMKPVRMARGGDP